MSKGVAPRMQLETRCQLCKGSLGAAPARKLVVRPGLSSNHRSQICLRHVTHVAAVEPAAEGTLQPQTRSPADVNGHNYTDNPTSSYTQQHGSSPEDEQQRRSRTTNGSGVRRPAGDTSADGTRRASDRRARTPEGREDSRGARGSEAESQPRGRGDAAGGRAGGSQRGTGYVRGTAGAAAGKTSAAVQELQNASSVGEVSAVLDKHEEEITLGVLTMALNALQRLEENLSDDPSPELQSLLDHILGLSKPFIQSPDVKEHIRLVNRLHALGYTTKDAKVMELLLQPINQLGSIVDLNKAVVYRLGSLWEPAVGLKSWFGKYPLARRIRGLGVWKSPAAAKEESSKRRAEESDIVRRIFSATSVDDLIQLSDQVMGLPLVSRGRLLVRAHQMLGKLLSNSVVERNVTGASQSDQYEEWQCADPDAVDARVKDLLQQWADELPAVISQHRRESFELNTGPVLWCWARLGWWPAQDIVNEVTAQLTAETRRDMPLVPWKMGTAYYASQGLIGLAHMPDPPMEAVDEVVEYMHQYTVQVVNMVMGHALSSVMVACARINIIRPPSWWEPLLVLHLERSAYVMKEDQLQHYRAVLKQLFPQWPAEWDQKLPVTKLLWEDKLSCEEICKPFKSIPEVVKAVQAAESYQQVFDIVEPHWGVGHQEYVAAAVRQISTIYRVRKEASKPNASTKYTDPELAEIVPALDKYVSFLASRVDHCFPWLLSIASSNLNSLARGEPALFTSCVQNLALPVAAFFLRHAVDFNDSEFTNTASLLQRAKFKWEDDTCTQQISRTMLDLLPSMPEARARICIPTVISIGVTFDPVSQGRVLKYIMEKKMYWAGFRATVLKLAPNPSDEWEPAVMKYHAHIWDRSSEVSSKVLTSIKDAADLETVMKLLEEQGEDTHPQYLGAAFRRIGLMYSSFRLNKSQPADPAADSPEATQPDLSNSEAEEDTRSRMGALPLDDSARAAARKLAASILAPTSADFDPLDDVEVLRSLMGGCAHLGVEAALGPEGIEKLGNPVEVFSSKLLQALGRSPPVRSATLSELLWSLTMLGYQPDAAASDQIVSAFLECVRQCEDWQMRSALRSLIKLGITFSPQAAQSLLTSLDISKKQPTLALLATLRQLCPPDTPGLEPLRTPPTSGGYSTVPSSPEALSQLIRRSRTLAAAQKVYAEHKDSLSTSQAALLLRKAVQSRLYALRQAAKASRDTPNEEHVTVESDPDLLAALTRQVCSELDSCNMDILQNFSYALSRMEPADAAHALAGAGTTLDALLPRLQGFFFAFVPDMTAPAYAETVWSLGRLGYAPDTTGLMVLGEQLLTLLPEFSAVNLRMLLGAFVGFRARTAPEVIEQLVIHVHEQHSDAPPRVLRDIMQSLESMCIEVRPDWSQKYVLCGQYWGRMRSAWAPAIGDATLADLKALMDSTPPDFTPADFILMFNRLAELAPANEAYQQAAGGSRAAEDDRDEGNDESAEGASSGRDWTELGPGLVDSVMAVMRERLGSYQGWQVARILQIAARLDARPEEPWLEAFLDHAMTELTSLSRNTTSTIVESLGRLGYFAGEPRLTALLNQLRADVIASSRPIRPNSVVSALVGAARVYFTPDSEWFAWFLECSQGLVKECSPVQVVEMVVALSRMNCKPGEAWLSSLLEAVEGVYPRLKPWDKARLVRALERIGGAMPLQEQGAAVQ